MSSGMQARDKGRKYFFINKDIFDNIKHKTKYKLYVESRRHNPKYDFFYCSFGGKKRFSLEK